MSPVWGRIFNFVAERAEGSYIYTTDGKKLLDFTCGIGVTNTGHCHPKVVEAIREQAGLFLHAQANIVIHKPMLQLIEEVRKVVPSSIDGFFFSNSGAEALEGAVKLARAATGKQNIIVFNGSFHGRTAGTMALTTSKTIYRAGFGPLPSGVFVSPYPYAFRLGMSEEQASQYALSALEELLLSQTAPKETAAILIEPVLGEGGYVVPPVSFMKGLREIADKNGILLIFDEVQSGFGRTGKWFASEHFGVVPDIMTVAKGIASGMPLSGVFSRLDLMKKWDVGSHGGTYGGNAVACAAGVATIRAMRDEKMIENAAERGIQLMTGLRKFQEEYPQIGDVRGLGLMIGTELVDQKGKPDKNLSKALAHSAEEHDLLLLTCGTYDNTIRWIPPLNVTSAQINDGLQMFGDSLKATLG
ncbi:MAG: aminotransferase class III-fold pyridoxal phosphate-dependent enzyme [Chloroflexi bacterium]|nr:aminotransferase class III-fold pyridoxal phosphate-dependent enzyme [Chloroflexota bacterium]MBI1855125.1 aminotransferase class III-fold pyridoxal phosphate-dependent enzyme [Chloroflexota bacterium]MBI3339300.1 aminotransferase class III-fold pyridoxal phosphate-dependent enzyme [Chloroflexota bacterium]